MKADLAELKGGGLFGIEEGSPAASKRDAQVRMAERRIDSSFGQIVKVREIMSAKQEEVKFLLDMFDDLSKIEPVKSWDDDQVQAEYWEKKLGMDIALRSSLKLPPDLEVIKATLSLPDSVGLKQHLRKSLEMVKV